MTEALLDALADLTGKWLAYFVVLVWGIESSARNATLLLPYDRWVMNSLLVLAIWRMIFRWSEVTRLRKGTSHG